MKEVVIDEVMAICSGCHHEFDLGDDAYVDSDGDYICTDCA